MRLYNTNTLTLKEFIVDQTPLYSILSHKWGANEVPLQDFKEGDPLMAVGEGWEKIPGSCKTAAADDFEWILIDTCCIDKTSSSELSEAINSMFRWYEEAEVRYVFLGDVPVSEDSQLSGSLFIKSRWFTRGWTLPELLAPHTAIFFTKD